MAKFNVVNTPFDGLVVVEPTVFGDARGFFMETYSERDFAQIGINDRFVQDNHSKSGKGVLRGLHFQKEHTQGKLLRVISGAVLDVAMDLRPESETYGQYFAVELSAENKKMLYVPQRFAHGFLTLQDNTEFVYKCTDYYHPESDCGVMWDSCGIDWGFQKYGISQNELNISLKDTKHAKLCEIDKENIWTK